MHHIYYLLSFISLLPVYLLQKIAKNNIPKENDAKDQPALNKLFFLFHSHLSLPSSHSCISFNKRTTYQRNDAEDQPALNKVVVYCFATHNKRTQRAGAAFSQGPSRARNTSPDIPRYVKSPLPL